MSVTTSKRLFQSFSEHSVQSYRYKLSDHYLDVAPVRKTSKVRPSWGDTGGKEECMMACWIQAPCTWSWERSICTAPSGRPHTWRKPDLPDTWD